MASPSLATLSIEFLRWIERVRGYAPTTADGYRRTIDQFRAYLREQAEDDVLAAFTPRAVMGFMENLAGRGVRPSSIVVKLAGLSSFAAFLMKRTDKKDKPLLASNPTKAIDWPTADHPETEYMRPDEFAAFLEVKLPMWKAIMRDVVADIGARRAELCRANVGDLVEMDGGWSLAITVKGRGTRRRKIHMPLAPEVTEGLRAFLLARGIPSKAGPMHDAAQPLLINGNGQRFNGSTFAYHIGTIAKYAGIERFRVSPQKVRHTVNVVRDEAGIDEYKRSRMLGQSSARSQERYRHIVAGVLREAKSLQAEGLKRYLGRATRLTDVITGNEPER